MKAAKTKDEVRTGYHCIGNEKEEKQKITEGNRKPGQPTIEGRLSRSFLFLLFFVPGLLFPVSFDLNDKEYNIEDNG